MQDPKQWQRAVYARLIKNKPEGPEECLRYRVEGACEWDKRRYGGGGVEESLQLPVVTHGPTVEQQLSEDEMALLQAHPAEDQ